MFGNVVGSFGFWEDMKKLHEARTERNEGTKARTYTRIGAMGGADCNDEV